MGKVNYFLKRELLARRKRNPRYSLRAFAKTLRMSPAFLSEVLSGKHKVSEAMLLKIVRRLKLNGEQLKEFQKSLKELKRGSRLKRRVKKEV